MLISERLRPDEVVRFKTPHYALAPLAGLQMQGDVAMIGDQYLVRCNRAEWETAERGYVFKDWHRQYYDANPVFLFKPFSEPIAAEAVAGIFETLARDAARIVTACRLYKTGRLLEPIYTIRMIASDGNFFRAVGPYRTEYLAMPVDGLVWPLEDDEAQDLTRLYDRIASIERMEDTESLRAVIDQFNLSHVPLIPSYFSVHVLLTSMEILFDGVRGRLGLETTRYERALEVLRWAEVEGSAPAFDTFFRERLHMLRNAIHHHVLRDSASDLDEARFRMQLAVMVGIRLLMALHCREASEALAELKKAQGWDRLGPKDLLNACLDRRARGDPAPLDEVSRWYV